MARQEAAFLNHELTVGDPIQFDEVQANTHETHKDGMVIIHFKEPHSFWKHPQPITPRACESTTP